MNEREKLEKAVERCSYLLREERKHFTFGNCLEMEKLLSDAKAALAGTYIRPFTRSRRFYKHRENEDILFTSERSTLTPGYDMKTYGLIPALTWFESTKDSEENVQKKDTERKKRLDAISFLCDNMFFAGKSKAENQKIFKERIKNNKIFHGLIEEYKAYAEKYSPQQISLLENASGDEPCYEKLNKNFYIWAPSEKIFMFVTPENAKYAKVRFVLPSCENEADGLGHIWLDDIVVSPAMGDNWNIRNGGFEDGLEGFKLLKKGNAVVREEHTYPFCGKGKGSVYLENPTVNDEAGIECEDFSEVLSAANHTLTFNSKIDGHLKNGVLITVEFYDAQKEYIGKKEWSYCRKAVPETKDFALTMQADAIMYFLTDDEAYAVKSKNQLMFILNDFCQGIEYWLVFDERPLGSDCYGGVQGGRIMASVAASYTFIKDVFTEEEKKKLCSFLEYFLPYLFDLRDRFDLSDEKVQSDAGNWQTDMAAGVGMMMMAMPEYKNSKLWLLNVNKFLKAQINCHVNPDGSWPESIRYHYAMLERIGVYAYVLKNCTGENWFADTPLKKMFRYPIMVQTPPYKYYDNKPATPDFGDHSLDDGQQFSVLAPFCGVISEIDKPLADMIYYTWHSVGSPFKIYANGENVIMQNLFCDYSVLDGFDSGYQLSSTGELF